MFDFVIEETKNVLLFLYVWIEVGLARNAWSVCFSSTGTGIEEQFLG